MFKTRITSNRLSADFVTRKQISLRKKASLLMVSIADKVNEGNKRQNLNHTIDLTHFERVKSCPTA